MNRKRATMEPEAFPTRRRPGRVASKGQARARAARIIPAAVGWQTSQMGASSLCRNGAETRRASCNRPRGELSGLAAKSAASAGLASSPDCCIHL
jgi:hypothetical protein